MIRRTSLVEHAGCAAAIQSMRFTALLPHIEAPALAIVGEEDMATPRATTGRLAALIPGAELVIIIKGAAHLPNIEQPAAFNAAIGDFLRRHEGVRLPDETGSRA